MLKALIVDDDITVIQCIDKLIRWQELGYEKVYTAMNGEEAYEILKKETVDVLICDLKMPVMGGMELVKKLREDNLKTEVILLTAYEDFSAAREGIELKLYDYMLKPLVLETIERLTDNLRSISLRRNTEQWIDSFIRDEFDEAILEAFKNYDLEYIKNIFKMLDSCDFSAEGDRVFQLATTKLIRILCDYLRENAFSEASIKYNREKLLGHINSLGSRKEASDRLLDKIIGIISVAGENGEDVQSGSVVSEMKKYIAQNYMQYNFGVAEVSEFFHYSKDHLNRIFKTEEGNTVSEYILKLKMEKAKQLILETNMPVIDVAKAVGYNSLSYFTSSYKRTFGRTPTAMRERNIYMKNNTIED